MIYSDCTAPEPQGPAFCWSRYGTEAGELSTQILARKEAERVHNGGVFLWGIGSNIARSLSILLEEVDEPEVRFSAMLSKPRRQDIAPENLVLWRSGVGLDGHNCDIPAGSVVTSRPSRAQHFALVCHSETQVVECEQEVAAGQLRNLRGNTPVGHSQVTSVVRSDASLPLIGPIYPRGFTARLTYPYLISLTVGFVVGADELRHDGEKDLFSRRDEVFRTGVPYERGLRRA